MCRGGTCLLKANREPPLHIESTRPGAIRMNIGITGASGFIGRVVVDLALRRGHEVIAFSRTPERGIPCCEMRLFSLERPPDLTGCDALMHLAGENIAGLWTPAKK